jgi:hypothetical protein
LCKKCFDDAFLDCGESWELNSTGKMEKDFDKEIDAILRETAKGLNPAESLKNHLDADEISLFAENLLPIKARSMAIEHFADCNNCRSVLVDVVSFREEAGETPRVNLVGAKTGFVESLKKLFSFPKLGFAMGALSILFIGIVGFVSIKNSNESSFELSKSEPQVITPPPTSVNKPASTEANSPVSSANSAANSAPTNAAASAANIPLGVQQKSIDTNTAGTAGRLAKSGAVASKGPSIEPENNLSVVEQDSIKDKSITKEEKLAAREPAISESSKTASAPKVENPIVRDTYSDAEITRSAPAKPNKNPAPAAAAEVAANSSVSRARSVGGKSFSNANGTWIDSAYKGGAPKTVNRGTKEFNELDSGLKSIADSLAEPVIIVWKAKNYRIQ